MVGQWQWKRTEKGIVKLADVDGSGVVGVRG
jgi:hypothetical protein